MQMKTYEFIERQVIPINGVNSLVIEVTDNLQENFHGIRYCGRAMIDNDVIGFASGFITLMCIPNDQISIPALHDEAGLNDSNSFIIAILPFMVQSTGASGVNNFGGVIDFDFAPKTSRRVARISALTMPTHSL